MKQFGKHWIRRFRWFHNNSNLWHNLSRLWVHFGGFFGGIIAGLIARGILGGAMAGFSQGIVSAIVLAILAFLGFIVVETVRHGVLGVLFGGLAGLALGIIVLVVGYGAFGNRRINRWSSNKISCNLPVEHKRFFMRCLFWYSV